MELETDPEKKIEKRIMLLERWIAANKSNAQALLKEVGETVELRFEVP